MKAEYDDGGAIGRRYRRQDEIGTPFAVTVDHQTLEDDTVTLRDRDTLAQERVRSPARGRAARAGAAARVGQSTDGVRRPLRAADGQRIGSSAGVEGGTASRIASAAVGLAVHTLGSRYRVDGHPRLM